MKRFLILASAFLLLSGCSNNWGWYVVDPTTNTGWVNL
jgi:polar amino acid transport system permease protein